MVANYVMVAYYVMVANYTMVADYAMLNANSFVQVLIVLVCWSVEFYGISTFVGYLTPNPFLSK